MATEEKKDIGAEAPETAEAEKEVSPAEESDEATACEKEEKEPKETRKERKEIKALKAEKEALETALAESDDKYRRMIAEYDNFRKRTAKERDGIYADAYADLLKEILPVKDALEMAVTYNTEGESKVLEGVKMTLAKFTESLTKLGIEEIGQIGEEFDPNLHNAVMHVEDESLGENKIAQVMLKGYKKGERILRFAMVSVAN